MLFGQGLGGMSSGKLRNDEVTLQPYAPFEDIRFVEKLYKNTFYTSVNVLDLFEIIVNFCDSHLCHDGVLRFRWGSVFVFSCAFRLKVRLRLQLRLMVPIKIISSKLQKEHVLEICSCKIVPAQVCTFHN